MSLLTNITASIVIYKEDYETLNTAINSFLQHPFSKKIYVVDNSPTDWMYNKIKGDRIEYYFSGSNLGFGRGHNKILEHIKNESDYHLILNPDVKFESKILEKLIFELQNNHELSMISPKVLYQNHQLQYTARKFPSIVELFCRFFGIFKSYTSKSEYKNQNLEKSFYPDFIQGSFMLFKTKDLIYLNGFDERYFLYMEDVDLCKKIYQSGKKILYEPSVEITHTFGRGSSKNIRLFFIHIFSMIKYFMKWGFKQ